METTNIRHRVIKRNHSQAIPRYIVAFDTETRRIPHNANPSRFRHEFRLGVAVYARIVDMKPCGRKTVRFTDPADFWAMLQAITRPNYTTWVVGHNIIFDLKESGFAERFDSGELIIDWPRSKRTREDNDPDNAHCWTYIVVDEPTTIIAAKMTATQGRIMFVDTLNYFPVQLSKIGKSLGIEKLPMPDADASIEDWFAYCERDVDITFECFVKLVQWVKENDMGMFRYTAPSQAMAAYRHRFMSHNIYPHENEQVRTMERQGFFGGRTECWHIGELPETVWIYDANSFYPFIMRNHKFPVVLDKTGEPTRWWEDVPDIDYASSIAVVRLKTMEANFPIRSENGVLYPVGRFTTILCGPELEYAHRKGYIDKVIRYACYRCEPIFELWVDELFAMRKEYRKDGNELYEMFVKFVANSLFGKFAQRTAEWVNVKDETAHSPWSSWHEIDMVSNTVRRLRSFSYQVQQQQTRSEIDGTFIAISAFTTAYGRMYMNSIRRIIGERNVYYQGTDSLIVNKAGHEKIHALGLADESDLGRFQLQLMADSGIIHGAADYVAGQRVVVAGRPLRQESEEIVRDGYRRFRVKESLFSGKPDNVIDEVWEPWERSPNYWKGVVTETGRVEPIQLDLW